MVKYVKRILRGLRYKKTLSYRMRMCWFDREVLIGKVNGYSFRMTIDEDLRYLIAKKINLLNNDNKGIVGYKVYDNKI